MNKIDRDGARPDEVIDELLDLFIELGADEDQLEFPVIYASGRDGYASTDPTVREGDMKPEETLFVDDGTKNIEAARSLGINVLQVKNGEDWRPALIKYLEEHK